MVLLNAAIGPPALAQLAPSGEHYAGRASDTGYGGSVVDAAGNFPASVPLELPAVRGGLPIPLEINYGPHEVGAAGLGWSMPLSYLRQSLSIAHRRPQSAPDAIPSLQQRTTLSLLGRSVDLVAQGTSWIARLGTQELVVQQSGADWLAYDGQGRTFTFKAVSTLPNEGLFLLKTITTMNGAKVELTYEISTWGLDGGSGTAIDLIGIDYNSPTAPTLPIACAKNHIALSYLNGSIAPIALSTLDDAILVRKSTLTQIDITSHVDCLTDPQRVRRYTFQYAADPDTGLPRLSTVTKFGQQGTPEETTGIPVASYTYGTATTNGVLSYAQTQVIAMPPGMANNQIASTNSDSSVNVPEPGDRYAMWQTLTDFDGDGRPDIVFNKGGQLWIAKGEAAPGGATTFGIGPQALLQLTDATLTGGPVSTQSSAQARYQYAPANRNTTDVWRMAIDINGDGRVDIVDAAEQEGHWVVYLNTPGGPSGIQWQRRSFSVVSLRNALVSSGHTLNGNYVPLSRRATGSDMEIWQCWQWENNQWNWYPDGFSNHRCQGVGGQIIERGPERTYVEWELADLNGDGYPDFVFDSDPVIFQSTTPPIPPRPFDGAIVDGQAWQRFAPKTTNEIRAAFNV
ncbi:MAG: VCBS repeat-containing protein, partial [Alphaproteobacteria bacterium]|nr:VCBS repeat-containing protein [Alphaproteobacteria bacterium]